MNRNSFRLDGKVALVTGGATGIGFAIAQAFAEAGARVALNGHNAAHMEESLGKLHARGIDAKGYLCDVTDEAAVREMVTRIGTDRSPLFRIVDTTKE